MLRMLILEGPGFELKKHSIYIILGHILISALIIWSKLVTIDGPLCVVYKYWGADGYLLMYNVYVSFNTL
jgi:hypothetical protein